MLVLDNATLPLTPNTATTATAGKASLTPAVSGSLAYSATSFYNVTNVGPSPAAGNTTIDSVFEVIVGGTNWLSHGSFVSTATLTAGTAFGAGASGGAGVAAAVEVQPLGGTPNTDGSSPAAVHNSTGTTAATASFIPPAGGKLILALASVGGLGNVLTVTDSYGLTWTQACGVQQGGGYGSYAAIWYAYTPSALLIGGGTPPNGQVGLAYSFTFAAGGGYGGPYTWSVTAGSLPAGLSLSAAGVLSGTPTTSGVSAFTVTVTDSLGSTASLALSMVIEPAVTPGGSIRAGWLNAAGAYSYGTLETPVATTEHDWVFVSVSWQSGQDNAVAYCMDSAHNVYQQAAYVASGVMRTQVFCVPDARAASTVYVSTSAFVRWLTVAILDVSGLQPGFVIDASNVYSGGPAANFTMSLSTAHPDFVFAAGAFLGVPDTITPSGSGVTWTTLPGGINGNASAGLTQAVSWALPGGAASPSLTYTNGVSASYSGVMVAVYSQGGLPVNANPAWPVLKAYGAFGYTPEEPSTPPAWTDISGRFVGFNGPRGRDFELNELTAADVQAVFDNNDGAMSPGGSLGADLITPVWITETWQGRVYTLFRGLITSLPQTWDFQRGFVKAALSDEFAKLPQILIPGCMIMEALFDKPVSLWALNEQQGAVAASNWSGRSAQTLVQVQGVQGAGQAATVQTVNFFGQLIPVGNTTTTGGKNAKTTTTATAFTSGFGQSPSGAYPAGLDGTQDTVWGNASTAGAGTALQDQNDSTLPLTSTGAYYGVWAQILNMQANITSGATLMVLDNSSTGNNFLWLYYNGATSVTVSQGVSWTVQATYTVPNLCDSGWHHWAFTVSTGGTVTTYLDGVALGSFAGAFPAGTPNRLTFGGNATATSSPGFFTGYMYLGGAYDRVIDAERIASHYQSGATGFGDELSGTRIQRVLAWARWSAPQAVDQGVSMQQIFNYLGGGYGSSGLSGAIGNFATAGGAVGLAQGAQADMTAQDVANTEAGTLLAMTAGGGLFFRQNSNLYSFPLGLALGDMDYPLNTWQTFEAGLGPWTGTSSCTVAQSSGWSYAGKHSALVTVTGTPVQAYAWGDKAAVQPSEAMGFSCWVMSPQGCSVNAAIDFYNASSVYISTANTATISIPPMTPVFLNLTGVTAPAGAAYAYPHPTIGNSPATGTQLYFDRIRLSPAGFQCPYLNDNEGDLVVPEDIQYFYNDVAVTRNIDQAGYRARNAASRNKYYPRVYTRTIYSSPDDVNALPNCANGILSAFATPAIRVSPVTVDAAANPEAWPFVLSADIGDYVSFTHNPVGAPAVSGNFIILHIEPDIGPDKARFTYTLTPS